MMDLIGGKCCADAVGRTIDTAAPFLLKSDLLLVIGLYTPVHKDFVLIPVNLRHCSHSIGVAHKCDNTAFRDPSCRIPFLQRRSHRRSVYRLI